MRPCAFFPVFVPKLEMKMTVCLRPRYTGFATTAGDAVAKNGKAGRKDGNCEARSPVLSRQIPRRVPLTNGPKSHTHRHSVRFRELKT